MRTRTSSLALALLVSVSLLQALPARAVVTVPVADAAGNPVKKQTVKLIFPSGEERENVEMSADGKLVLPDEDDDEDGLLIIVLEDGSRVTAQLTAAGAVMSGTAIGLALAAVGTAVAVSSGDDNNNNSSSDSGTDPGTGPGTGPGDGAITGSCTYLPPAAANNEAGVTEDLSSDTVDLSAEGETLTITFNGPVIVGEEVLECQSDEVGLFQCTNMSTSVTWEDIVVTEPIQCGADINEAGDGFTQGGCLHTAAGSYRIATSFVCDGL